MGGAVDHGAGRLGHVVPRHLAPHRPGMAGLSRRGSALAQPGAVVLRGHDSLRDDNHLPLCREPDAAFLALPRRGALAMDRVGARSAGRPVGAHPAADALLERGADSSGVAAPTSPAVGCKGGCAGSSHNAHRDAGPWLELYQLAYGGLLWTH